MQHGFGETQCVPSNFHGCELPVIEGDRDPLVEAGGWQEGARLWLLGCERVCAGAQGEGKAGEELLRYKAVSLRGALSFLRKNSKSGVFKQG